MAMAALRREGRRLAPLISNTSLRSSLSPPQEQACLGIRSISTQIVRNRMKSVKNIQKITKAMKMVAASKLRAIQVRAENSRGLWQPFTALLGDAPSVDVKKNVIVTISSDKGLCGGINSTSVKISRALHKLTSGPEKETKYVVLGEKAKAMLVRDSKKDIEIIMTELQKHPLNYTQSGTTLASLACRRFSTSTPTPETSDGTFPSDLLSTKKVASPERKQGIYQDLVMPITNFHYEDKGFMVLAGDVFDVPIRKDIIHRVVRWQLAKRQQGTHSTKTISEVSGTGRKPWNQKGTGRARHGTLRGPQFRGGCVMHGPKPRSHAIKLNKKVRRLGLKIALSARAAEGKLMVFDDLEVPTHKTKNIVNYVKQWEGAKKFLLVDGGPLDEKLKLATQNLHYVNILPSIGLNVYSILQHDTLVMSRDAVNRIVERMHTPINR